MRKQLTGMVRPSSQTWILVELSPMSGQRLKLINLPCLLPLRQEAFVNASDLEKGHTLPLALPVLGIFFPLPQPCYLLGMGSAHTRTPGL